MTEDLRKELEAAGYSEAAIAKEEAYLARVAWENDRLDNDPDSARGWGYGFHHAGDED